MPKKKQKQTFPGKEVGWEWLVYSGFEEYEVFHLTIPYSLDMSLGRKQNSPIGMEIETMGVFSVVSSKSSISSFNTNR